MRPPQIVAFDENSSRLAAKDSRKDQFSTQFQLVCDECWKKTRIWWRIIGAYRDRSTATGRGGRNRLANAVRRSCCRFRNHVPAYRNGGGRLVGLRKRKLLQSSDGGVGVWTDSIHAICAEGRNGVPGGGRVSFPELAAAIAVECVGRQLKRCRERPLVASAGTRCDPCGTMDYCVECARRIDRNVAQQLRQYCVVKIRVHNRWRHNDAYL